MKAHDKFLVRFLDQVSGERIFFIVWGALALFFAGLILRYWSRTQVRNFRPDDLKTPRPKEKVQFKENARLSPPQKDSSRQSK